MSYLIFAAIEQLAITLQNQDITLQEAIMASTLAEQFVSRQRTDNAFDSFYSSVVIDSKKVTAEPVLPRQRRPPKRIDDGTSPHTFSTPKDYFRKQYFEVLDIIASELNSRFQQKRGIPMAVALEKVLLHATHGFDDSWTLPDELQLYEKDVDLKQLIPQLRMLPDLLRVYNEKNPQTVIKKVTNLRTLCDVMNDVSCSKVMFSEIFKLLRIVLTIPVTTATAERSFSTLRRLKTFLRSTMSQPRLNYVMMLHIHKDKTDQLKSIDIAKEFISFNDQRKTFFGNYGSN